MKKLFTLICLCVLAAGTALAQQVYTVFDEGILTYYYDDKMASRSGEKKVYDQDSGLDISHPGYVQKAVIDPSMKDADLYRTCNMFPNLFFMESIEGLENLNTSNVTNMAYMFADCSSLESLDLSSFNTENVTSMTSMFSNCNKLVSLDLSSFNTENVTDMSGMFMYCRSLTSLDLSSFNTEKVTNMRNMFRDCEKLTTIICEEDWSKSDVLEDSYAMFEDCTALVGGKGTAYDEAFTDATYARPDGGKLNPGYFTAKADLVLVKIYTVFDEGTLTYYYDDKMASRFGEKKVYDQDSGLDISHPGYVQKAVIDPSMKDADLYRTCNMFPNLFFMESIEGLENLNTSNVTNMAYMFADCSSLESLDLSSFNTENVTDMSQMFMNCNTLTSLDLSSFNTEKVTDMRYMFINCSNLTTIFSDSDWSGSGADSEYMFDGCTSLVGGMGTAYNEAFTDATYARPDGGTSAPGYFTGNIQPEDYDLYVSNVQVTSSNANDILGDGGTFTYNAKKKMLTINNSYTSSASFLIMNSGVDNLTIYVANDVELSKDSPDFLFYLWKSTTITGPGKLTLNGNIGIIDGEQLTIEEADIELRQTTTYAIMGNLGGEKLLVRNSSIHAVSYYLAIANFDGGITIEDSMLEQGLRISDNGAYICQTDGGDANDVTIYNLEYITGIKTPSDSHLKGEEIFNLAGQRLSKMQKGINIVGGKKIIKK